jgi:hypothetical protein
MAELLETKSLIRRYVTGSVAENSPSGSRAPVA